LTDFINDFIVLIIPSSGIVPLWTAEIVTIRKALSGKGRLFHGPGATDDIILYGHTPVNLRCKYICIAG